MVPLQANSEGEEMNVYIRPLYRPVRHVDKHLVLWVCVRILPLLFASCVVLVKSLFSLCPYVK
jgi:hypothetical protein